MEPTAKHETQTMGTKAASESIEEENAPTDETKNSKEIPCRYHMKGRCSRGESCNFSHTKAESLRKINILKENFALAFNEAEEEIKDPAKNPNMGMQMMQLKKLHSLKKDVYSGLRNITQKVRRMNLRL